jgi:hypothetical protein
VRRTGKRLPRTIASIDPNSPLRGALDKAGPKPAPNAARDLKKNYAERLSRNLAILMANGLRQRFPHITPGPHGTDQESVVGGDRGRKRLDVKVWDDELGLVLSISIKTYSFQDWDQKRKRAGRYTKNISRNDLELRGEADTVHRRQPYAVLFGIMFMPINACDDGVRDKSSFAHAVLTFRKRGGRADPDDKRFDLFERVFIGLYDQDGDTRGHVRFFDVMDHPPRNGRPRADAMLSFAQLLDVVDDEVATRNQTKPIWGEAELVIDEEKAEG